MCRMCGKAPECIAQVLAGCSSQTKYLERHNAALKVLFFEILRDLDLNEIVPPTFSCIEPNQMYESTHVQAFWDFPVYAEHTVVYGNRVDACIVYHKEKRVLLLEMSCPWVDNRVKKEAEKSEKYGPLRWELTRRYPGYRIVQLNVIMDVLGGWCQYLEAEMKKVFVLRSFDILKRMQKEGFSGSLNLERMFKVIIK